MKLLFRPSYYDDIAAGVEDLARQASPHVAERWAGAVLDTTEQLALHPGLGRRRRDLTPAGVRSLCVDDFERWLIFYLWHEGEDVVELVRVVHGMMDLPRALPAR